MDKIFIKRLEAFCIIGIFGWERRKKQRVWIDLEIPSRASRTARTDSLKDAVDYKRLAKATVGFVRRSRFLLIETLAERTAQFLLAEFDLPSLKLTLMKPGALRFAETVGITLTRQSPRKKKKRQPGLSAAV